MQSVTDSIGFYPEHVSFNDERFDGIQLEELCRLNVGVNELSVHDTAPKVTASSCWLSFLENRSLSTQGFCTLLLALYVLSALVPFGLPLSSLSWLLSLFLFLVRRWWISSCWPSSLAFSCSSLTVVGNALTNEAGCDVAQDVPCALIHVLCFAYAAAFCSHLSCAVEMVPITLLASTNTPLNLFCKGKDTIVVDCFLQQPRLLSRPFWRRTDDVFKSNYVVRIFRGFPIWSNGFHQRIWFNQFWNVNNQLILYNL